MCGIAGIVYRDRQHPIDREALTAAMRALAHRGPDDHGQFVAAGIGLASTRLAILDLSPRGHMPMQTPDGRFVISYNGEVYNFRQLRDRLASSGVACASGTDTEVLLRLFERHGPGMLPMLNGMFALAIWDTVDRTLFVARDRLGVKPACYVDTGDRLLFASEQKALFALGASAAFDARVVPELLCQRFVAGDRTPFAGVSRLLPGHYLLWKEGRTTIRRWWHLAERARELASSPPADAARWFRETFDEAVDLRRISDVPVGVLLSAGLDSTSVAASLASRDPSSISSFTVRFTEAGYDESTDAARLSSSLGLTHHQLTMDAASLEALLERAAWLSDEPIAHASDLHLLAIADYAKPHVSVLLSGEGADETLGGYTRYQPLRAPAALAAARLVAGIAAPLGLQGRARKLARLLTTPGADAPIIFNACDVLPRDLSELGLAADVDATYRHDVLADARTLYPRDPFRQALYLDLHTYLVSLLHRNDRMTMGASIECRVPFLDYRLVEGVASLSTGALLCGRQSKPLLRAALGSRLPDFILERRKWGFGVPWSTYLRDNPALRARLETLHRSEALLAAGCSPGLLSSLVKRYLGGDRRTDALVFQLFMLATWHRAYFSRLSSLRHTATESDRPPSVTQRAGGEIPVLLVGNFLSATSGTRSVCEDLALRLPQAGCPVVTTSTIASKVPRLLDMLGTALIRRDRYVVAQVDVFSGAAFFWAEAVCCALRRAGKPYVLTLHGGNLPAFSTRWPARVRRLLGSAAAVTTPSPYLFESFASVRPDIRLLRNGLDAAAYMPRPPLGADARLVCLRAFHRIYNPGLAVRALPLIARRYPQVHLTMAGADKGDGTLQETQRLVQTLGVADRVTFHGAVPKSRVPEALRSGSIFLNTTNVESVGVTTLEAMASGLCVVSTNVGGLPYLIEDGRNGLLVPPDDPAAMADAVLRILDDPSLAARLSRAARETARTFDWPPIITSWRSLFESAAGRAA